MTPERHAIPGATASVRATVRGFMGNEETAQLLFLSPTGGRKGAERPQPAGEQSDVAFGVRHEYGEANFTCERNGIHMGAYVLASTTVIPTSARTALWYADTIFSFLAPEPMSGLVAGLLVHMVKSVKANSAWVARQSKTTMDVSHIAAQTNA